MGDMLGLRMNKQVSNSDSCLRQSTGSLSLTPYCGTAVCGIPYGAARGSVERKLMERLLPVWKRKGNTWYLSILMLQPMLAKASVKGWMRGRSADDLVTFSSGQCEREQHPSNVLVAAGPAESAGLGLPMGGVFILEMSLVVPHTIIQEKKQA